MIEKQFLDPPIPNPKDFEVVVSAPQDGEDYWTGGPSVYSDDEGTVWLTYRVRDPEERGREVHIARSQDGYSFEDINIINKSELGAKSLERSSLIKDPRTGDFKLYMSPDPGYEAADPQALGWHIVKLDDVSDPADFDPETARVVISPEGTGSESGPVKDPYVLAVGWKFYMFYTGKDGGGEQAHLATSVDGENWQKLNQINPVIPRNGWHDFHTRVGCVLPMNQGFVIYYEGTNRQWYQPMYNVQTGVASSLDLRKFTDVSPDSPVIKSPTSPGETSNSQDVYETLRYMDYALLSDKILFYYEAVNESGAFELRVTEKSLE